jgi:hypothetical protein
MDPDLQDLLALWLSDQDPGEARREALLARLRTDNAFRAEFIAEIHMHGMLRVVQSSEPRWLGLEDAIGWSTQPLQNLDEMAAKITGSVASRIRLFRTIKRLGLAAAVLFLAFLAFSSRPTEVPSRPEEPAALPGVELATVLRAENVTHESGSLAVTEGCAVRSGPLRIRSGTLTLAFFTGVALSIQGPADLELLGPDKIVCRSGKIRARVPRGAEGFTVIANGFEIVDLGTDFALTIEPDGKSRAMVFEGEAAVTLVDKNGSPSRGAMIEEQKAVEIDPMIGRIQDVEVRPENFIQLPDFVPTPLELTPGYAETIMAAEPWGYWRFERIINGLVQNEIAGRPGLIVLGGIEQERSPKGNHYVRFQPQDIRQGLLMDGTWTPPRMGGFAIELWIQADLPSPRATAHAAIVSLIADDGAKVENHLAYLELAAHGRRSPHEPTTIRFLDRWPADTFGGSNVFSRRNVVLSVWRHVLVQKNGEVIEIYVDGQCFGTSSAVLSAKGPDDPATTACRLLVGRLKKRIEPSFPDENRGFEGRIDELAIYDYALSPAEIRRHAQLRVGAICP